MNGGELHSYEYVELAYDPVERLLVITKAEDDTASTLRWVREKDDGIIHMRKCGCTGIAKTIYDNMGWVEDYKYRIVGNKIELDGKPALVFYLADPIIIVPVKPTEEAADREKSIVTKETLPEDTTEIPSDEYAEDGTVEKSQAKSRAIYFDDFVAKQETEFHVADLGDEKYSPECIKRLLQKKTAPAEGWIYLKGMAKLTKSGFTIFPEDWESNFGPSIYERESVKVDRRFEMSAEPQGGTIPYGWTVGLELPTQETVDTAIAELRAGMAV